MTDIKPLDPALELPIPSVVAWRLRGLAGSIPAFVVMGFWLWALVMVFCREAEGLPLTIGILPMVASFAVTTTTALWRAARVNKRSESQARTLNYRALLQLAVRDLDEADTTLRTVLRLPGLSPASRAGAVYNLAVVAQATGDSVRAEALGAHAHRSGWIDTRGFHWLIAEPPAPAPPEPPAEPEPAGD